MSSKLWVGKPLPSPGDEIGGYRVELPLGKGAMGATTRTWR
jgi:hypothetical protein